MVKKIFYLITFLFSSYLYSQQPAEVDTSFGVSNSFRGIINTVQEQNDGKILVGGNFSYNSGTKSYLVRLNPDGTEDINFNIGTGFNGEVTNLAIQFDGKILVGGSFTTFQGNTQNRLIRLNADGSKDSTFDISSGFNGSILSIATQNDQKIIVGGNFTNYQGISQKGIIRLNIDASKDLSFDIGTGFTTAGGNTVNSICIQNDGKILVGGGFSFYQNLTQNKLIRLNSNGSKDTSFDIGSGFTSNNSVFCVKITNEGKIYVGGAFSSYKGISENRLIRLNSDGTKDNSFSIGTGFSSTVNCLAIQNDDKILVSGSFTSYQDNTENRLVRLNIDGSKDNSLILNEGFNDTVNNITISNNNKLYSCGYFLSFKNTPVNPILKLNLDGTIDNSFIIPFGNGFNSYIKTMHYQNNGKIIVAGSFTSYEGNFENHLMRLNNDGTKDLSFDIGSGFDSLNSTFNSSFITSIIAGNDGKILVGGSFNSFQGTQQNGLIRLNTDGSKDYSFDIGTGFNGGIESLAIQNDGKILVAGSFTAYKGNTQNRLIRLNSNGSKDTTFDIGTGFNGVVIYSIKIQNDGKILVGGLFTTYQDTSQNFLIRLNQDGSKDNTFNIGIGFNNTVTSIEVQNDNKILVGGNFTFYQGIAENRLIRLNSDGSKDNSFNTGSGLDGSVTNILIQNDDKIVICGGFNNYNSSSQKKLIQLNTDGTIDNTFSVGNGFNSFTSTISLQNDGKILVAGNFTSYNSTQSASLIRLLGNSVLSDVEFEKVSGINIYPNPTNSVVNIEFKKNSNTKLTLLDVFGKKLLTKINNDSTIDLTNYSNGIYFLKIENDNKVITRKIIKQ